MKPQLFQTHRGFWVLFSLLLFLNTSLRAAQNVGPMQVYYTGDHLEILIKTESNVDYSVSQTSDNSIAVRFENATASAFQQDPSYIWDFIPVTSVSHLTRYSTVYLKIDFAKGTQFRLTHRMRPNGLHLYLWGNIVNRFNENVYSYASRRYAQLTQDSRQKIEKVFRNSHTNVSDQFLVEQEQLAAKKHQFTWMKYLVTELERRKMLSGNDLKHIATTFDNNGRLDLSESLWYKYYQQQVASGDNPYKDTIPAYTNVVKSQDPVPSAQSVETDSKTEPLLSKIHNLPLRAIAIGVLGVIVLSILGSGIMILYRKKDLQTGDKPQVSKQEQLEATFAAKLDEIRSAQQIQQMEKPPVEREVPEPKMHFNPELKNETRPKPKVTPAEEPRRARTAEIKSDIPRTRKKREVERLYKQGLSLPRIARNLNLSEGEVKLLLKIGDGDQRRPKMRLRNDVANIQGKSVKEIARLLKISEEEAKLIQMTRSDA